MLDPTEILPLTDFQRNAKKHLARLKKSGRPEVLTVNGRPAAVVQDPESFRKLTELADEAREMRLLEQAVEEFRAGKGRPLREALRDIRAGRAKGKRRKIA